MSQNSMQKKNKRRRLFYVLGLSLPVLQFCIFYIGVNFNTILLAFQRWEVTGTQGKYVFNGLNNFKDFFRDFKEFEFFGNSLKNSAIAFLATLVGMALSLFFSFYVYKKAWGSEFFRTMLFMPKIISAIILVILFKFFAENAVPELIETFMGKKIPGLLDAGGDLNQRFWVILIFNVWVSFGSYILLFGGAMGGISESIVEAAQIDGITPLKEFWFITLPMIFPTISTFLLVSIAAIFTNQMSLFSFYGDKAEQRLYTFGYYLYRETQKGELARYPYLASIGLLLTVVTVPMMMGVRKLLKEFGPSVN